MSNYDSARNKRLDDLREREVKSQEKSARKQTVTIIIQAFALLFAFGATAAAAYAALQAGEAVKASQQAVKTSQQIAADQAAENRLDMAVKAIGEKSSASQIAGVTLLRRTVKLQLRAAQKEPGDQQHIEDAYDTYSTALDVIPVYLRETTKVGEAHPIAADYAAAELRKILDMGFEVSSVTGQPASIDLAAVGLAGIHWGGVNFDSLESAWMKGIDLRVADLVKSHWGPAALIGAHLQCADLKGADLSHANLAGADLRGANLTNATPPPATNQVGMDAEGAVSNVPGWKISNPATTYRPAACMKAYPLR